LRNTTYGEKYYPFAVNGDFDGNGKLDWVVLLKQGDQVSLLALHHAGSTWKSYRVWDFSYQAGFQEGVTGFNFYLEPVRQNELLRDHDLGRLNNRPGDGFKLVYRKKAAWLWKWDGNKFWQFSIQH
jgi:hypothetical protein